MLPTALCFARRGIILPPNFLEGAKRALQANPTGAVLIMAKELKQLVVPEFTLIAEVGDEPVGFILCVPDINVAFRKINGRLTSYGLPIGLAKLLYHKSRIRTARLIALGVKQRYRRGGIAEMLVLRIIEDAMTNKASSNFRPRK